MVKSLIMAKNVRHQKYMRALMKNMISPNSGLRLYHNYTECLLALNQQLAISAGILWLLFVLRFLRPYFIVLGVFSAGYYDHVML